ncbi:hypothetical protein J0H58_35695 [bacterium]|nr:hypothetical protein [bacterium]
MPHVRTAGRVVTPILIAVVGAGWPTRAAGQETVTLAENFRPNHAYKVDVRVQLQGKLAIPQGKDKAPQLLPVVGASRLTYDERVLEPDEANSQKTVRSYREVEFRRMVGNIVQDAGIRPSVRRLVVIRANDRRAPFSPDGPLTWGEIDVVRTDVFNPTAVPGLLPAGPVKTGQKWPASPAAVAELTDMEKVDEGGLTVEYQGVAASDGKRMARLRLSGTVRGVNEDGPNRQKLEGTAFFDLDAKLLTYLSVKGTHELLDGTTGMTTGSIDGHFVMTRTPLAQQPSDLSDASLRGLALKPDAENTLLLYDDPGLGVRFLYPRGWRQRLAEAVGLGGTTIRIRGERQFNDEYTLLGGDADEVAACFGEELVALCLRERNLVLEARDGSLLVYWDGEEFPPRELADRLAVAYRVLRLLAPPDDAADDGES